MENENLYRDLLILREKLRIEAEKKEGRYEAICDNKTLEYIANRAPKMKKELSLINGLGKTFEQKYGDAFMDVINKYNAQEVTNILLTNDVTSTLKNYENRLVNINKKNRLLYASKIYNRYGFDLNESEDRNIEDFVLGKGKKKIVLWTRPTGKDKEASDKGKRIVTLLREVNKDYRDSGRYELYVGYPYLQGYVSSQDFVIRAPLALFPVKVSINTKNITMELDDNRDALYNSNLLLMFMKSLNKKDLPNTVIESFSSDFINQLKEFYNPLGISWNNEIGHLSEYAAVKVGDKSLHTDLNLINNAILGKFPLCSSAIQSDFEKIIDQQQINNLVSTLLQNVEDLDYYGDSTIKGQDKELINEQDVNYINDLDYSQEKAVLNIDNYDELVIQGPPGTGKSQTITSLIINYVMKGHNVLMVSQKKAALDVIYSRLGLLNKYCVLCSDVKDKEAFYSQINTSIFATKKTDYDRNKYSEVTNKINVNMNSLRNMTKQLQDTSYFGAPMWNVYGDSLDNYFMNNTIESFSKYSIYLCDAFMNVDYNTLKELHRKMNDEKLFENIKRYLEIIEEYPWMLIVNRQMDIIEITNFIKDANALNGDYELFICAKGLKKCKAKNTLKKSVELFQKRYFSSSCKWDDFVTYIEHIKDGIVLVDDFQKIRVLYDDLNDVEKLFLGQVRNMTSNEHLVLKDSVKILYDLIVFAHISKFETTNRPVLVNIDNFRGTVRTVLSLIKEKKEMTKSRFEEYMNSVYDSNVPYAKRYTEIQRNIESCKKISIARFIDMFQFELFSNIKIWLMTPEVVSEALPLENGLFDLVIFDEASQLYIEKGIPTIQRAKKVIVAGDHKQLRPSNLGAGRFDYDDSDEIEEEMSDTNAALEEESLLDLARFKYPEMMLNYHYRSRYEELIDFSNYAFYDGKLNISPNIAHSDYRPIKVVKVDNGLWDNRCNKQEAVQVVKLLKQFFKNRQHNETVGIITFNSNQRDLIYDFIDEECQKDSDFSSICMKEWNRKDNGEDNGLFVKNIENVQGDERDCIIFSIGYASDKTGKIVRNYGWLNQKGGENRLNVAITRAKQKIYIVTSINSDQLVVDDLLNDGPKIFKKYLRYCEAVSQGKNEDAETVLKSFVSNKEVALQKTKDSALLEDVYNELKKAGLPVEKAVGIGKYKIEIALSKGDKYVMGIECEDAELYNLESVRARDIHRKKYLESRGWNIYRVYSLLWWHDKEKEIENIKKYFEKM